jgi:Bacteriophage HK97-gp10, putative tail-component
MSSNIGNFIKSIKTAKKRIRKRQEDKVKSVVFEAFGRILEVTPVDLGTLRSSWGLSKSTTGQHIAPEGTKKDFDPSSTWDGDYSKIWWIYNRQPYAVAIEYGHSKQSSQGMVRLIAHEIKSGVIG